jgi:hypothetical protein
MLAVARAYGFLALPFTLTIAVQWLRVGLLMVGTCRGTRKDKIRREVDQRDMTFPTGCGESGRAIAIHGKSQLRF